MPIFQLLPHSTPRDPSTIDERFTALDSVTDTVSLQGTANIVHLVTGIFGLPPQPFIAFDWSTTVIKNVGIITGSSPTPSRAYNNANGDKVLSAAQHIQHLYQTHTPSHLKRPN